MTRRGNRKKLSTRIKEKAMGNRGYRGTGLFNCYAFPSWKQLKRRKLLTHKNDKTSGYNTIQYNTFY